MDKKYQVFLSSTYIDLQAARQKVLETILDLQQFPAGMEVFPAGDDDQWTHIKSVIDTSDYYILILGHRYGSLAPDKLSYTEKEYDYARARNIPVLAFIRDRNVSTQEFERENVQILQKKLDKFIEKAKANKLCRFWRTPEDLAIKVSTSLATSFSTHPQMGWVRGDQVSSPKVTEELVELNRENRQLKMELEIHKKLNEKSPLIKVAINEGRPLDLKYQPSFGYTDISIPQVIKMEEVPDHLIKFIKEEDLEEYNQTVPKSAEKALKYNKQLKLFKGIEAMGLEVDFSISNIGSAKANNIYVDFEFPDSVKILEGDKERFSIPATPSFMTSPLKKAEALYDRGSETIGILDAVGDWGYGMLGMRDFNTRTIDSGMMKGLLRTTPRTFYSSLKGNTITVISQDLIQTMQRVLDDDYVLLPKKPGKYEVKVSIICEEYSERDEFKIPFIIRED